jgi:DUF1365 family protein
VICAPTPRLYLGQVMHRRVRPTQNRFVYPVFFLSIPLSNVEALANRWVGVNRPGLFSFRFADHGARDGTHPLEWVRGLLAGAVVAVPEAHRVEDVAEDAREGL